MKRRQFLHKLAHSATLFTAARALAPKTVLGAQDRVRVGLIGCGGRGMYVANLMRQVPGVEFGAICDLYDKALARGQAWSGSACPAFQDFRRVLDRRDIDAVLIATPDHWHAIPAVLACQAGKDVYVEKPLAHNIAEGKAIVQAAHRFNRVVQVGLQQRSAPHYAEVARIIQSGQLGRVSFIRIWNSVNMYPAGIGRKPDTAPPPGVDWDFYLGPAPLVPFNENRFVSTYRWFWDYGGGLITDFGTHRFDSMRQIMEVDAPRSVTAAGGRFGLTDGTETPDFVQVTYEYPGFVLSYEASMLNAFGAGGRTPGKKYYQARGTEDHPHGEAYHGTNGTLIVDRLGYEIFPELTGTSGPGATGRKEQGSGFRMDRREKSAEDATGLHVANFIECVRSREKPRVDAETGHRSTIVAHLGNIAYRTGHKIHWNSEQQNIADDAEAAKLLRRSPRKPWDLLGCLIFLLALPVLMSNSRAAILETPQVKFEMSSQTGGFEVLDKQAQVSWQSNPYRSRFGEIIFNAEGQHRSAPLDRCEIEKSPKGLAATFHPLKDNFDAWLRVSIRAPGNSNVLEFVYEAGHLPPLEGVRLLEDALWVTDQDNGYLAVPVREGLLIPAESGRAFSHRFDTYAYEGCHMEMFGAVKQGAAALITWRDPYVAVDVRSVLTNAVWVHGRQVLSPSVVLRKSARDFRIQFLGKGDYVTIGKAYRVVARERGWFVPWDEKLKDHPERAQLFGAINFKLWSALDRRMNEASTVEEQVRVNWTFDEAAQVSEHLKHDLQLDKVLFFMGGWIHRGYDNQHPDILPTASECGGDAAFVDCAHRVRQLGYLFGLHDNYQDIYRDSPSWNEDLIMKNHDGSLMRGGHWAGGLAFLTCSEKALELAKRPQNLPAVKKLCEANAYFIDTTYAAGLQECFDPKHPLTRIDDMHWKQALSDYARNVFGIFGSECGREWAIPHADFFEGLTGVSGRAYHDAELLNQVGGAVVPLFELVYRDCIAMYGKYGYDISRSADYVLQHITIARPLNYHEVPPHLYWKGFDTHSERPSLKPEALFTRADRGWAQGLHPLDRFVKNTAEILSPLNELTARLPLSTHQFLTEDRKVERTVFGTGAEAAEVIVNHGSGEFRHWSREYGDVVLPSKGFFVESPQFVALLATTFGGVTYSEPTLFTVRSLEPKPIASSTRVRVYHGFGDVELAFGGTRVRVERELTVAPPL
jgi:predicted dehydrogenase